MTYKSTLPGAFPYLAVGSPDDIHTAVDYLLDPKRRDVPQGSSFAVTVDNWDGSWNLWLSRVSHNYLKELVASGKLSIRAIVASTDNLFTRE